MSWKPNGKLTPWGLPHAFLMVRVHLQKGEQKICLNTSFSLKCSLSMEAWLTWNTLCRLGWTQTQWSVYLYLSSAGTKCMCHYLRLYFCFDNSFLSKILLPGVLGSHCHLMYGPSLRERRGFRPKHGVVVVLQAFTQQIFARLALISELNFFFQIWFWYNFKLSILLY